MLRSLVFGVRFLEFDYDISVDGATTPAVLARQGILARMLGDEVGGAGVGTMFLNVVYEGTWEAGPGAA